MASPSQRARAALLLAAALARARVVVLARTRLVGALHAVRLTRRGRALTPLARILALLVGIGELGGVRVRGAVGQRVVGRFAGAVPGLLAGGPLLDAAVGLLVHVKHVSGCYRGETTLVSPRGLADHAHARASRIRGLGYAELLD